jgi:hypothetical protein
MQDEIFLYRRRAATRPSFAVFACGGPARRNWQTPVMQTMAAKSWDGPIAAAR